ncbi:MAG: hypothetical protein HY852_12230 [Bradyrhizobium sp.]|uniref:hypothetical protein n=1 Tax=Bradyrhizobium sp. TaxID=376 RepID=UPI0025C6DB79|nr:hypothetical protein [Bradyrhizobium sp.]MBI5262571.1 hypothetical protein [Bradyrhizobium sp.]
MNNPNNFVDKLTAAARENPLGAALVAGGALWFLLGNQGVKSAASGIASAAEPVVDITARNIRNTGAAVRDGVSRAAEAAGASKAEAAGNIREGMQPMANSASETFDSLREVWAKGTSHVMETAGQFPDPRETVRGAYTQTRTILSDLFERQPLALGAIGLAVGGMVASAFQSSALENEMAGPLSDKVKNSIQTRAAGVSQSLREGADVVRNEVSDMTAESIDRLKRTGDDALRAARETSGA